MAAVRARVADLQKEWQAITGSGPRREKRAELEQPRHRGKLKPGIRTPEDAYYRPILQALVEMGGSGRLDPVLERIEQLMKGVLRPVDYEPISSNPNMPRWRNGAQWARRALVKRGYLKGNSRHGLWEISDAGRAFLAQSQD